MAKENYRVQFTEFPSHLTQMVNSFRNDKFTDVTLISNDKKEIKAHKNILAACSSLFKDLFNSSSTTAIFLRGIDHAELEAIIQFIYVGEVAVAQDDLEEFMEVAKSLEINQLIEKPSQEQLKSHPIKEEISEEMAGDESETEVPPQKKTKEN